MTAEEAQVVLMAETMNATQKALVPALQSAPEPKGDDVQTECEYCHTVHPNETMHVIGDHWLCDDCNQDGDALYALSRALEKELDVVCAAYRQMADSVRFRAPLREGE